MNPQLLIQLALGLLAGAVDLVNQIKSQHGVGDDVIAAQVQTLTQGNDAAYNQIISALGISANVKPAATTVGKVNK